ncbi:glycosyltransferase [Vibrio cholerae]|uniref:glycosyltransferase n=1 Tax=Vibrio cholerae TaxID=666 RepID=UPI0011D8A9FC|nr:glycosyltransferase [Vibrio cholerae]EGR0364498.1 glycosyltransferase [Vibrio cholerae]EGR0937108.1 glycosyltransferase [Vibrio cholerae]EIA0768028.1 glycosyltransferase [Vibrio cholerae]EID0158117.1 glycosyltransferase [Vibrio cholerae]EJL6336126.1 glycosyltransferase [Vibrio cholerae]
MKNIHITLTEFRNESRVLKEISSLEASETFDSFTVIALGADDLPIDDSITSKAKVRRIRLLTRKLPKSALFQLIKFIEFMFKCLLMAKKEQAQVVNIHTLALLPLGWLLKKLLKVKLVYDAHELETEKNGLHGFRQLISKYIESIFIRSCDLVIVVGENIADWYANAYKIERPLVVKNSPRFRLQAKKNLFRERLGILPNQKILLYQGGLVQGRGVQLILDAFKERKDSHVVAVFMGYGDLTMEVEQAAKSHKNIFYFPAVSPNVVLDYTASADIGIHLIQNTCLNHYFCMPNKFFEYAMAGLPVVVSYMKEMAEAVQAADFGVVLSEYSVEAINEAVDRLSERDLTELSNNAYLFAQAQAWEQQERVMLEGYQRMLA